ncbi:stearoyl-CoA 9-desaturase [Streptomyces venezuelae]|uniref:Stearoyl-CoA 9-desaturase n=1 Tax=Streptomyces venezuelae TaxID=54571 RepID=A0A5P2BSU7_STRVZ|nr:ferredoxin reductase [Streptomyces venezuelae]QES33565.1 stearoyl-CoA 9-desaturase [Streptomyces venezuelae]
MPAVPALVRGLLTAVSWLTSPLTPDDYLGLVNPLLDARFPVGRVTAVSPETADVGTLTLRPGRGWSGHRAGQYLPVDVEVGGVWHWRTYSLTSVPGREDGLLTITVKAAPDGTVSPRLVHRTFPGAVLRLGPAQGEFVLPDQLPPRILMVTAGSGITPVMGMLRTLMSHRTPHPDVVLVHSAPRARDVVFRSELHMARRQVDWLDYYEHHSRQHGRLAPEDLGRLCPDWRERETWACGPAGLLDTVEDHWGHEGLAERLHVERFRLTPVLPPEPDAGPGYRVLFTRTGAESTADATTPLLVVGESAGAAMPYGCRRGVCFGCLTPLTYGRVRDLRTGEVQERTGQMIQTCVSAAAGPLALDA